MTEWTALRDQVASAIDEDGYIVLDDVLSPAFVERAKRELTAAIECDSRKYGAAAARDYAMVMLCALYGGPFLELFEIDRLVEPFNAVLGDECIVYAYTSSSMPPRGRNYSVRVHTDCPRVIPGYVTNMGATILLDDFTEENGATWFLPRSQWQSAPPSDDEFYRRARRLVAPAGSVLFFNARLWHAGGENRTDWWRHALTINMCRPYMKQRIDIPRAMADMDLSAVSDRVKQKLGFFAQPPASLEEYYLPAERRSFRQPTR
ncbi:MAG TPA: phytanoyl-CoA dioxygenase family protein [Vicinamibacterales bacterium]|nr:phytanoyl-CoA dioxygenase family protein [Vicinamibacterales bacterium]